MPFLKVQAPLGEAEQQIVIRQFDLVISKFSRAFLKRRFDKMQEKGYRNEITVVKAAIPYFIVFHKFCLDMSWGKILYSHWLSSSSSTFFNEQQIQTVVETLLVSLSCPPRGGTTAPTNSVE